MRHDACGVVRLLVSHSQTHYTLSLGLGYRVHIVILIGCRHGLFLCAKFARSYDKYRVNGKTGKRTRFVLIWSVDVSGA